MPVQPMPDVCSRFPDKGSVLVGVEVYDVQSAWPNAVSVFSALEASISFRFIDDVICSDQKPLKPWSPAVVP